MQIMQRICQIANDPEVEDRLNAVRSTFDRPLETLIGFSGLLECLGEATAKRIADRFAALSNKTRLKRAGLFQSVSGLQNTSHLAK